MTKTIPSAPITRAPYGHVLTNTNVWSPDSKWIVYDVRSDAAGSCFDGTRIERVQVDTGEVEVLYRSLHGAYCGVVTYAPRSDRVVLILGPEHPTADWQYAPFHRRGVEVEIGRPMEAIPLDAMDYAAPFTPGALRGGSHVHVYSPDERYVSFTYEDHHLATLDRQSAAPRESNQRNVGVAQRGVPVIVPKGHPRNHDGTAFSVLVTTTQDEPRRGSDEICRAFEDAWIGQHGYPMPDGTWRRYGLAFLGECLDERGEKLVELFVADLGEDLAHADHDLICGTESTRPSPPKGVRQRRLTYTQARRFPGIRGPRHWPRSHPDGNQIATLMQDDQGIVQLFLVSTQTGQYRQLTSLAEGIIGAFSWSPDGESIACLSDHRCCIIDSHSGELQSATERYESLRPEACVFSPDGRAVAFVARFRSPLDEYNQIMVAKLD